MRAVRSGARVQAGKSARAGMRAQVGARVQVSGEWVQGHGQAQAGWFLSLPTVSAKSSNKLYYSRV